MTDPLGLSVGATNLVAVRPGRPPVLRPTTSTPPEANPESIADELDALGRLAGYGAPVWIAVPAHWDPAPREALRGAVLAKPGLTPGGAPPVLITDVAATIAALRTESGLLPAEGVVALCDFGGTGTSITLLDAATDFAPLAHTQRLRDFSGERIDQQIMDRVIAGRNSGEGAGDPGETAAAGTLAGLRDECRSAKERLSKQTETAIGIDLPGFSREVPLTRDELIGLTSPALTGVARAVVAALDRNNIAAKSLTTAIAVGGGAALPALGKELSKKLRVPVIVAKQPGFAAATGAVTLAASGVTDMPTSMTPTAWAADGGSGPQSATFRALAWSQEDAQVDEPVPYTGEDYRSYPAEYPVEYPAEPYATEPYATEPLAWYKRPAVLFGLAAALALTATGGLAFTLTGSNSPAGTTTGVSAPAEPPDADSQPPEAPATVTVTAPDGSTSLSTIPASPSPTSTPGSTESTSTAPTTTRDTTSAPPSSTKPSTESSAKPSTEPSTQPSTKPSTKPAPSSTGAPATTTAAP